MLRRWSERKRQQNMLTIVGKTCPVARHLWLGELKELELCYKYSWREIRNDGGGELVLERPLVPPEFAVDLARNRRVELAQARARDAMALEAEPQPEVRSMIEFHQTQVAWQLQERAFDVVTEYETFCLPANQWTEIDNWAVMYSPVTAQQPVHRAVSATIVVPHLIRALDCRPKQLLIGPRGQLLLLEDRGFSNEVSEVAPAFSHKRTLFTKSKRDLLAFSLARDLAMFVTRDVLCLVHKEVWLEMDLDTKFCTPATRPLLPLTRDPQEEYSWLQWGDARIAWRNVAAITLYEITLYGSGREPIQKIELPARIRAICVVDDRLLIATSPDPLFESHSAGTSAMFGTPGYNVELVRQGNVVVEGALVKLQRPTRDHTQSVALYWLTPQRQQHHAGSVACELVALSSNGEHVLFCTPSSVLRAHKDDLANFASIERDLEGRRFNDVVAAVEQNDTIYVALRDALVRAAP